jgi:hypothetical protein
VIALADKPVPASCGAKAEGRSPHFVSALANVLTWQVRRSNRAVTGRFVLFATH